MKKRAQAKSGRHPGGRPRDERLAKATALVDVLARAQELDIKKINGFRPDEVSQGLLALVASLSDDARETGRLSRADARAILAYQYSGSASATAVDSFAIAEKRHRKRRAKEGVAPFDTKPNARVVCTCSHRHCSTACKRLGGTPVSCLRLMAEGETWMLPSPCHASSRVCNCHHVHCDKCRVGVSEHDPSIQPVYSMRIVLDELELERIWIGWLCPDCTPQEFKPVALPAQAPRKWLSPACPKCGCDVLVEGDVFRCVGLDAESTRLRTVADMQERLRMRLLTPTGVAGRKQRAVFRAEQQKQLLALPVTVPAVPSCGRAGPVTDIVSEQHWRAESRDLQK